MSAAQVAPEILREGGAWLGAVRGWMQWNKQNGSDVIWGSDEELRPAVTVRQLEEAAATAVAADRLARNNKLVAALESFLRAPSMGSRGPGSVTIEVTDFNLSAAREALALAKEEA